MPTTTLEPHSSPERARDDRPDLESATHTGAHELEGQVRTMQAIVHDQYGSADVLRLQQVDKPSIGADGVLLRVQAAGGTSVIGI